MFGLNLKYSSEDMKQLLAHYMPTPDNSEDEDINKSRDLIDYGISNDRSIKRRATKWLSD